MCQNRDLSPVAHGEDHGEAAMPLKPLKDLWSRDPTACAGPHTRGGGCTQRRL